MSEPVVNAVLDLAATHFKVAREDLSPADDIFEKQFSDVTLS